ncbi:MAG: hypothetical protein DSZ03_07900 [Sulfurimonas sp.]|nr:MAG: hypothetical protein DSZ03_07900 [Sulfurimonas sp.]
MGRDNSSSIDSGNGHKLAHLARQQRKAMHEAFQAKEDGQNGQVVNAKKAAHLDAAKAKAKKKAKMAKASRKRNK